MEEDIEDEHKREVQRQQEREAEKQRIYKLQLEEQKRREREEIEKANVGEEEKKRLLREHSQNMQKLEENLKTEQESSRTALASKLEARRQRRREVVSATLEQQLQMESDQERKRELQRRREELGQQQHTTPISKPGFGTLSDTPITSTGNTEQDWVNLLMASPLFKQISELGDLLDKTDISAEGSGIVLGML